MWLSACLVIGCSRVSEMWNRLTLPDRSVASPRRLSAVAESSSTVDALRWMDESIWTTDRLSSSMPLACWLEDSEISSMVWEMASIFWMMDCRDSPDLRAMASPAFILLTVSSIRAQIWLEASAERWARLLTSSATTAKPLPCSPALAASTAAFSASRLVWKATSLTVTTMSPIFFEASEI